MMKKILTALLLLVLAAAAAAAGENRVAFSRQVGDGTSNLYRLTSFGQGKPKLAAKDAASVSSSR